MKGIVVFWPYTLEEIPHGWHECDGTMGTPDMRGRLPIGANETYVAGTTGGGANHTHTLSLENTNTQLQTGAAIIDSVTGGAWTYYNYPHAHTGVADEESHMPPWYAGYWIQKL